jgi:hypothetical protein
MCSYGAAQIRAIAAPVALYGRRPIERLTLQVEGLIIGRPR